MCLFNCPHWAYVVLSCRLFDNYIEIAVYRHDHLCVLIEVQGCKRRPVTGGQLFPIPQRVLSLKHGSGADMCMDCATFG